MPLLPPKRLQDEIVPGSGGRLSENLDAFAPGKKPICRRPQKYAPIRALLEDLVCQVVVHFGLVVELFEIGVLEQLRVPVAKALADRLLNARVVQIALAGGLP